MYDNEYEEYMRSVLGYPPVDTTYYTNYTNNNIFPYRRNEHESDYSQFYPDIYKILKPMVSKVCSNYRGNNISDNIIDEMAMEVYNNIESDMTVVNVNVTTSQDSSSQTTRNMQKSKLPNGANNSPGKDTNEADTKSDLTRSCKQCNPLLRDLIKILIINQLLNNNNNKPSRPPINPYPPVPGPPRPPYRAHNDVEFY